MSNKAKGSKADGKFLKMKSKIHIWDLPIDKTYIKLDYNFGKYLFDTAYKKFKSWSKLGNFLDVKRGDTLIAKNWRYNSCCYPLSSVFTISKKLGISKRSIEKNIIEIKCKNMLNKRGGNGGKSIINPRLPIKINEDFMEILGHICGDGSIVRKNPHKGISLKYTNSEPTLINSFQEKIKKVFGDINPNVQVRSGKNYRRENFCLQYPTILSFFILSVFDCKSKDEKDLPEFINKVSKKSKFAFLRAMFDDEGSVLVKDKSIIIGLKPKNPVDKIRSLLIDLGFNPGNISNTSGLNRIKLGKKIDILLFKELIGFKHPFKNKKLDKIIEEGWKFERYENDKAKDSIICLLKDSTLLKTEDIIKTLNRCPSTVRQHLNNLKLKGLISCQKENKSLVWSLK